MTITQTYVSPAKTRAIAEDVYIYGYPLVTLEMTRRVTTNTTPLLGCAPRWANSLMRGRIRLSRTETSRVRMPTHYIPRRGSISPRNRTFSRFQTPRAATS